MGRFAIGILTLIAELELERIRENWSTAIHEAVGRGIHISARVPFGYRQDPERRLVADRGGVSSVEAPGRFASPGMEGSGQGLDLTARGLGGEKEPLSLSASQPEPIASW
jgi:hypothetical protein